MLPWISTQNQRILSFVVIVREVGIKEQNILVPHCSVGYLWILGPLNTGVQQILIFLVWIQDQLGIHPIEQFYLRLDKILYRMSEKQKYVVHLFYGSLDGSELDTKSTKDCIEQQLREYLNWKVFGTEKV